jgi:hypothetical protein
VGRNPECKDATTRIGAVKGNGNMREEQRPGGGDAAACRRKSPTARGVTTDGTIGDLAVSTSDPTADIEGEIGANGAPLYDYVYRINAAASANVDSKGFVVMDRDVG